MGTQIGAPNPANRKSINCHRLITLAGLEDRAGECRLIRRIGRVLRFQRKAGAVLIDDIAFANIASNQKIAAIKLDPGLLREDFHHAAGCRFVDLGCLDVVGRLSRTTINNPIVV